MPPDFAAQRADLVERQLRRRGIADARVLAAMGVVPRERFVLPHLRERAYEDGALPIGHGQTISQPFVVAAMCELLGLDGTERVLDVGTGSGYAAAVLAELAAEVISIERLPALAEQARSALDEAGRNGSRCASGTARSALRTARHSTRSPSPLPPRPSHRRSSTSSTENGRIVVPRGSRWSQRLVLATQTPAGLVERASIPCRFVPLVGAEGFR